MTNAYRGANYHTEMAAKYTKLGHLEEMLYAMNTHSHWVIKLTINGSNADFVSGRDANFYSVIKSAIGQLIVDQHKKIVEATTESKVGK